MKKTLQKLLIITLIILLINTFFINSFSAATVVPYLQLRNSGLSEQQRLALVNAGNYLTTKNFPYLLYCTQHTRNTKFALSGVCSEEERGNLVSYNVGKVPNLQAASSARGTLFTTSCADYCSYIYDKILGVDSKYLATSCYMWIQNITDYNNPSNSRYDEECPLELVKGWDTTQLLPGDILIYTNYKWGDDGRLKPSGQKNSGHAMLYLGNNTYNDQITGTAYKAHASGHGRNIVVDEADLKESNSSYLYYIIRVKGTHASELACNNVEEACLEDFDTGNRYDNSYVPLIELAYPDSYAGIINYGQYTTDDQGAWGRFSLANVFDKILGFMILIPKIIVIGFTAVIQKDILTGIVNNITGMPLQGLLTVEKIVFNQVPILDINFFNFDTARWSSFKRR